MKFYENRHHHDDVWKDFMLDALGQMPRGSILEFGVADGTSALFICNHIGQRELHGFDWFRGLPESWYTWEAGHFDTNGQCRVKHPNLRIFNGLFADTLPSYLANSDDSFAFVHIDCDLYSSTKTIFDLCHERIVTDTILVFDEALWHKDFMEHEGLAFIEFSKTYDKKYEVIGATSDGQMSVRIK